MFLHSVRSLLQTVRVFFLIFQIVLKVFLFPIWSVLPSFSTSETSVLNLVKFVYEARIDGYIGYNILKNIEELPAIAIGARFHHERYDGKGYPLGMAGQDIPEIARIIAVADAYDAMTSNRSYRELMPQEKVKEEIRKGKGTQFDPVFADIMLALIEADKGYCMHG